MLKFLYFNYDMIYAIKWLDIEWNSEVAGIKVKHIIV